MKASIDDTDDEEGHYRSVSRLHPLMWYEDEDYFSFSLDHRLDCCTEIEDGLISIQEFIVLN